MVVKQTSVKDILVGTFKITKFVSLTSEIVPRVTFIKACADTAAAGTVQCVVLADHKASLRCAAFATLFFFEFALSLRLNGRFCDHLFIGSEFFFHAFRDTFAFAG